MERKREVGQWRGWKLEKDRKGMGKEIEREAKMTQGREREVGEMERWNREVGESGRNGTEK